MIKITMIIILSAALAWPQAVVSSDQPLRDMILPGQTVYEEIEEITYRDIFAKDYFMGDSITQSLSYYKYLSDEQVISKLGFTLKKAGKDLSEIARSQPECIYLLFGSNDLGPYISDESFLEDYQELLAAIKEVSPLSKIYIQSVLPVSEKKSQEMPYLNASRLDVLNEKLKTLADEQENVVYINLRKIIVDRPNENLYEPDGIHLVARFGSLWLDYLHENTK